jgi:predicted component of type VI protein secretion system
MAPQSYQLVVRTGPNPGETYELNSSEITIGRESTNDIVITDAEVSRKHARLVQQPGGYLLEDLGSTNGTFVNGQRLMGPHSLRPGELVVLGENVSMSFDVSHFDPDATVVGAAVFPSHDPERRDRPPDDVPARPSEAPPPPYRPEVPEPYQPSTPPGFSEPIPSGPEVFSPPPKKTRTTQNWILAGCGCLLLSLCACVGFVFLLDQLNLLCNPVLRPAVNLALSFINPIFGTTYYCP